MESGIKVSFLEKMERNEVIVKSSGWWTNPMTSSFLDYRLPVTSYLFSCLTFIDFERSTSFRASSNHLFMRLFLIWPRSWCFLNFLLYFYSTIFTQFNLSWPRPPWTCWLVSWWIWTPKNDDSETRTSRKLLTRCDAMPRICVSAITFSLLVIFWFL